MANANMAPAQNEKSAGRASPRSRPEFADPVHRDAGGDRAQDQAQAGNRMTRQHATPKHEQAHDTGAEPHQEVTEARQQRRRLPLWTHRLLDRFPSKSHCELEEDLPDDFQYQLQQELEDEFDGPPSRWIVQRRRSRHPGADASGRRAREDRAQHRAGRAPMRRRARGESRHQLPARRARVGGRPR